MMHTLRAALAALLFCAPVLLPAAIAAYGCVMIESVTSQIRNSVPEVEIRVIAGPPAVRRGTDSSALVRPKWIDGSPA
jgi:hypothetical protein